MIKFIAWAIVLIVIATGCQTKFVQMVEVSAGDGKITMATLDEDGRVWLYAEGVWHEVDTHKRAPQ